MSTSGAASLKRNKKQIRARNASALSAPDIPHRGSGRPPIFGIALRKIRFSLDDRTIARAREIGNGNASGGLRIAVAAYRMPRKLQ